MKERPKGCQRGGHMGCQRDGGMPKGVKMAKMLPCFVEVTNDVFEYCLEPSKWIELVPV